MTPTLVNSLHFAVSFTSAAVPQLIESFSWVVTPTTIWSLKNLHFAKFLIPNSTETLADTPFQGPTMTSLSHGTVNNSIQSHIPWLNPTSFYQKKASSCQRKFVVSKFICLWETVKIWIHSDVVVRQWIVVTLWSTSFYVALVLMI